MSWPLVKPKQIRKAPVAWLTIDDDTVRPHIVCDCPRCGREHDLRGPDLLCCVCGTFFGPDVTFAEIMHWPYDKPPEWAHRRAVSHETESAPQTLEEKLSQGSGTKGKARRPLPSLRSASGFRVLEQDGHGPVLVEICGMDIPTKWRRLELGAGGKFEQQ